MEDDGERKALISRIGTYFILIGLLAVTLFVASDMGEITYFRYFFMGAFLFILGVIFKRVSAGPANNSKRFEWLRKMRQKEREAQQRKSIPNVDRRKK